MDELGKLISIILIYDYFINLNSLYNFLLSMLSKTLFNKNIFLIRFMYSVLYIIIYNLIKIHIFD